MMSLNRAAVFAALFYAFGLLSAAAQDVMLTSRDGAMQVGGTLLGFDGEFYRVDTVYGPLTVDGQGVTCAGAGCPDMTAYVAHLTLSGSPALGAVLMPALIEAYAARQALALTREATAPARTTFRLRDRDAGHLVAEIGLVLGSTDEGFADLVAREADLVMAAREPRPAEVKRAQEAGLGDLTDPARRRVVALDAVVPVVAPEQPVQALAITDMRAILTGEIADWSTLGGADAPVSVHLLHPRDGLQQSVAQRLLKGARPVPGARRHADAQKLDKAVARDPLGLGLTRYSARDAARQLPLIGGCGTRLAASRESIKTEDYPFAAPLFLYGSARLLPPFARDFLAYLQSPAAQLVVRRAGFVDQSLDRIALARQGDRLAQAIATAGDEVPLSELQRLVRVLAGAERLTSTFRFRNGATEMDAQSYANVAALAGALEAGLFNGRTLVFVGFTDGAGSATANLRIARDRATAVHDAVRAMATAADPGAISLRIEAFGEALPIACDQSDWGGLINRRVEVWLR